MSFDLLNKTVNERTPSEASATDITLENKERKNRNENENPIILALLIGQETILSL